METVVVVLAVLVVALTTPFWWIERDRARAVCVAVAALLLAGSLLLLLAGPPAGPIGVLGVAALAAVAVAAGGPATAALLASLERPGEEPGETLRGGAWIGVLERAAVFVCIVFGHPAAVAVVVAVKGLGRYPEIQGDAGRGAAERFIAGTLASLLWAGACALLVVR